MWGGGLEGENLKGRRDKTGGVHTGKSEAVQVSTEEEESPGDQKTEVGDAAAEATMDSMG